MKPFAHHRPPDLATAVAIHADAEDPRYLAGGQSLIPVLRMRLDAPTDLIDLAGVPGLAGVHDDDGSVVVGAMTPHADVADAPAVRDRLPAVAALASAIGDPLVRNRGTIGGALANADPAADWTAAVLGLGATVTTDRRGIAADEFVVDMYETALEPGEIVTGVRFPVPARAAYARFANPASGYPIVGVFAAETADGPRVAVTGAAPFPFRLFAFEDALSGGFRASRLDGLDVDADGLNADIHAGADYRAHLIGVLARRAVDARV